MPLVTTEMNINHALKEAGIIPDVIEEGFIPETMVLVKYDDKQVELGNRFTPQEAVKAPEVTFIPSEEAEYTLFLVDPDAPSREDPKYGLCRHWVATYSPEGSQEQMNITHQNTYLGPAPPADTGDHRYIFLLYKHKLKNENIQVLAEKERINFNVKQYADDNHLELVGVNFFYSSAS
ncbi:unnamed protein product [Cunninghamella blakesleeana]